MPALLIMVSGPFSADDGETRRRNLERLEEAARAVRALGHVPVIGENCGLPMRRDLARPLCDDPGTPEDKRYIQSLSLDLCARCDAVLRVARSPGADREAETMAAAGGRVFESLDEIPPAA
jgi:hypothetical protein